MGSTDSIKLWITYLTAMILAVGSLGAAVFVWMQPVEPSRDVALIFGLLGTAFGASTAFLFGQEAATRAARSSEKAHEAGVYAGLATPTPPLSPIEDEFHGDPEDGDLSQPVTQPTP